MTDSRNDLIAAFIRMIADELPKSTLIELQRLEAGLRREWGGERVYVGKIPGGPFSSPRTADSTNTPHVQADCRQ